MTGFAMTLVAGFAALPAFAQSNAGADVQRDANQQNRIEQGLKSGQLSTQEAGSLERQETHVDNLERRDMRNGSISPAEQQQLNAAQNHVSQDIHTDKTNGVTGNPDSRSSQRMQADVQRNANQQQRIANGIHNGTVTNREAGSLERGQAHVDRNEANAAANGHIGAGEQARIQGRENHQSARIYNKKHNAINRR
jgi:hypothetical protein